MDVQQIIEELGGRNAVAEAAGCDPNSVLYWERRGRVPVRHWPAICAAAQRKGVEGITANELARIWSKPRKSTCSATEVASDAA